MPKFVDHDERRVHIVEVTWDLLLSGGSEAATMREIASRAGFANGALKYYFESKDAILTATFERALAALSPWADEEPRHGLEGVRSLLIRTLPLDQPRTRACRALLVLWDASLSNSALAKRYSAYLQTFRAQLIGHLREGRADGTITASASDDELASEALVLTAGASALSLTGAVNSDPSMTLRRLDSYVARL